jgi:hypothetical protein
MTTPAATPTGKRDVAKSIFVILLFRTTATDPNAGTPSSDYNDPVQLAAAIKLQVNTIATSEGQPLLDQIFCARSSEQTFDCNATSTAGVVVNYRYVVSADGQTYLPAAGQ